MTDYNKIITTVNSITPDYQFIPDLNNTIVIDTSENRIGINTITPDENIHVSGGTIKTEDLIVLGDFSINNIASDLIPRDDLSYNIGSIDYRWNDLFVGSGSIYMDKTRIIRMGDYTRHGGNDISALIIDNSGKHLDISDIRHVNIEGDVSINKNVDIKEQLTVLGDVSFMSKFYIQDDTSFNNRVDIKEQLTVFNDVSFLSKLVVIDDSSFNKQVDISGVLHIKKTNNNGVVTGTKIYTVYENNSAGNPTTRLIIDPSGDGITGSVAEQGEVVILGNLDVKGTSTFIKSTNVDISDNIIRMNANHNSVTDGGISVTNSSNVDKLFTYNNAGDYWTTNDTNINLGPNGGVVTSGFMNIDNVNIDGNTISSNGGTELTLVSDSGTISTNNDNINVGSGSITANGGLTVDNINIDDSTITSTGGNQLILDSGSGTISTNNDNINAGNGSVTANGGLIADNINIDGSTITSTGGNQLILDSGSGTISTGDDSINAGNGSITANGGVNAGSGTITAGTFSGGTYSGTISDSTTLGTTGRTITTLNSTVNTNASNISTNTGNISTNAGNISTVSSNLSTLQTSLTNGSIVSKKAEQLDPGANIAGVSFNGTTNINIPYSNLTGLPTIPSAVSDLTNDTGFITSAQVPTELPTYPDNSVSSIAYLRYSGSTLQWSNVFTGAGMTLDGYSTGITGGNHYGASNFYKNGGITGICEFTDAPYFTAHESVGHAGATGLVSLFARYTGSFGGGVWNHSDDRLKHNELDIINGLDIVRQMKPQLYDRSYEMNDANNPNNFKEVGLIAQDILAINDISFAVKGGSFTDASGVFIDCPYFLNYNDLFSYHIAGTKELDTIVQAQATEIAQLKSALNELLTLAGKSTI